MNKTISFLTIIIFAILIVPNNIFPQGSGYKVIGSIDIGGEGRWDYTFVDASTNQLFVSHGTKVNVVDLNTNKTAGVISGLNGVHGIATAPEFAKGYISNGKNDTVTVFDLKSLITLTSIKVTGKNPDAIVYDPFSKRIFTFNGRSSNATAIDAEKDEVVGTLQLDGKPEFAVSDKNGKMFVNIEDKSIIEEFDPKTLQVLAKWSIKPCKEPSGLAIDIKNNKLFSVGDKITVVVDINTGKLIGNLKIGDGPDACVFDSELNMAYSSNGEGTLSIIKEVSPVDFKVLDTIVTQKGLRTMALDPVTHKIYLIGMLEGKDKQKSFGVLIVGKE